MGEGRAKTGGGIGTYRRILVALDGTHTSNLALHRRRSSLPGITRQAYAWSTWWISTSVDSKR